MKNDTVVGVILRQHHVSNRLKIFGEKGVQAVLKKMKQLNDRMVIQPVDGNKLTEAEKKKALQYLMFLKEKRYGKIKG